MSCSDRRDAVATKNSQEGIPRAARNNYYVLMSAWACKWLKTGQGAELR
jgi:hypothetical protein